MVQANMANASSYSGGELENVIDHEVLPENNLQETDLQTKRKIL